MSDAISSGIDSIGSILENRTKFAKFFDDAKSTDMSIDTFYQLLIAEMTNQDPLEPMSNTEFVSQMAAFTSLRVQQEALYYNNSSYASSMAGKTVIVATSTGAGLDVQTGVVTRVNFTGGDFTVTVNGREDPLKNVMEVLDSGHGVASGSDGAFATSLIGKYVTAGVANSVGSVVIEKGIVDSVEIKDGELSIIIDNVAYPIYSVLKIEPAERAAHEQNDNEIEIENAGSEESEAIAETA